MKNNIYIISGFSGAGKSSLCKDALNNLDNIELIKSYTTRLPRGAKDDGYHFVSKDTFKQMDSKGEFLETNFYNDNYYGTPLGDVKRCLEMGKDVVLEIDVHGYHKILECSMFDRDNIHSIFVVTDAEELSRRLCSRSTEDMNKILSRMQAAVEETKTIDCYDVILDNDNYHDSVEKLRNFFMGEELENDAFDKEAFVKEAAFMIELFRRGKTFQNNEYVALERYYAKEKNDKALLATLGAHFAMELTSMGNYQSLAIAGILRWMSEVLNNTGHPCNARKIQEFAEKWME